MRIIRYDLPHRHLSCSLKSVVCPFWGVGRVEHFFRTNKTSFLQGVQIRKLIFKNGLPLPPTLPPRATPCVENWFFCC